LFWGNNYGDNARLKFILKAKMTKDEVHISFMKDRDIQNGDDV